MGRPRCRASGRPGAWRDPDSGGAGVSDPPPWAPERFDAATLRRAGRRWRRSGSPSSARCPSWWTSCSWPTPPDDPDSWQKAIAGDELAAQILGRGPGGLRDRARGTRTRCTRSTLGIAEAVGRKLGKAQAPIRVAVMGRTAGPPALRLAGGARPGRDAAAVWRPRWRPRLTAALDLMLLAPLALGAAHCASRRRGDRPLLRRHPGAGVADLAPVRSRTRPGPSWSWGRRSTTVSPPSDLRRAPRRGAEAVPPGRRPPDHADRGKQPGDKCTEAESGAMYLEARVCRSGHPPGGRQRQLREHR